MRPGGAYRLASRLSLKGGQIRELVFFVYTGTIEGKGERILGGWNTLRAHLECAVRASVRAPWSHNPSSHSFSASHPPQGRAAVTVSSTLVYCCVATQRLGAHIVIEISLSRSRPSRQPIACRQPRSRHQGCRVELRSTPSGPDDRDRVAGKRALALGGVHDRRERARKKENRQRKGGLGGGRNVK